MKKYLVLALANFAIFTSFSYAKTVKHGTGLIFDDTQYSKVPLSTPLLRGSYDNLPSSVSLKDYAPTAKNQGQYGTCVGWATAYAARTIAYNIRKNTTDKKLIDLTAFSPSYVYNQISDDITCKNGTFIDDALRLMQEQGVANINLFPYECNKQVEPIDRELAAFYKISGNKKLFDLGDSNKIEPVKKSLSENKPVLIGMRCCTESFEASYGKDVWDVSNLEPDPAFGHAMAVIGYDDNKYGGSFLLMNSWGEEWGNSGFIYVRYDDFKRFTKYAFELIEVENGEKLSGELKFKTINGEQMPSIFKDGVYQITKPYNSGTLFRLYVSNNEPAFIYAFGSDSTQKAFKIFPHKENISPYLGYKNSEFALPDEDNYIRMDNTKGNDYFCFLYSKKEIDINNILQSIEAESGTFQQKIEKVLNNRIINENKIDYSKGDKIAFSATSDTKDIVPVIIKMEHK